MNSKFIPIWFAHILSGNLYKHNIIANTHPRLTQGSHNYFSVRKALLDDYGIFDDPFSEFTKFLLPSADRCKELQEIALSLILKLNVPDEERKEIEQLVKNIPIPYKVDPEFFPYYNKDSFDPALMNKPFFGRRILHVLSPLRWKGNWFLHDTDSNFKVAWKTIQALPECHHSLLVPLYHNLSEDQDNITIIPFDYPKAVTRNRTEFNQDHFLDIFDSRGMDFDFVFCHQPELLTNIKNAFSAARYGCKLKYFVFFHWIDNDKNRHVCSPTMFWRQLEAISEGDYFFFHTDWSADYLKINKDGEFADQILEKYKEKLKYMPLGPDPWSKPKPIPLPANKKILLFNHRWNGTTGTEKLLKYTKDLGDDWVIWITDNNAKKIKAVKDNLHRLHVQYVDDRREYRYLIENCYASLVFVDKYCTWNLSVQDALSLNIPTLVYGLPVMAEIIGKDYPLFFNSKDEFIAKLNDLKNLKDFKWNLPDHDKQFIGYLSAAMMDCLNIH